MKFIHCADIHLDSPLLGLDKYEGAPVSEIRGATRRAFEKLVRLAIDEEVSFVIIAGDLYDGNWLDYNTGLFFVKQMSLLNEAGIPVFLIKGNHDAASKITRHLRLPENVHLFRHSEAETRIVEKLGVAIHGQSFADPAVFEDLSARYPTRITGMLNIGILHTCATGREGHDRYAPCDVEALVSKGYTYWALGHIHQREVLHENPWVIFSGNTQGRHFRESGVKSCELVTAENGEIREIETRETDVLRWVSLRVDISSLESTADILEEIQMRLSREINRTGEHLLACRIELSGRTSAHRELSARSEDFLNQVRALATDVGRQQIWIQQVKNATSPVLGMAELAARADVMGEFARISEYTRPEDFMGLLAALRKRLPIEVMEGPEGIDLEDTGFITEMLDRAGSMALNKMEKA